MIWWFLPPGSGKNPARMMCSLPYSLPKPPSYLIIERGPSYHLYDKRWNNKNSADSTLLGFLSVRDWTSTLFFREIPSSYCRTRLCMGWNELVVIYALMRPTLSLLALPRVGRELYKPRIGLCKSLSPKRIDRTIYNNECSTAITEGQIEEVLCSYSC